MCYRNEQDASYDTYPKSKQKSDEIIYLTKKSPDHQVPHSLHDGVSLGQPPPKPKRDWSSLSHDYANVKVTPVTPGPEKASFDFPDPGTHSRQGSREETIKSSQFLDQQMAKLMAKKTSGQDEVDGAMRRSKSGDNLSRRNSEILDDDTRRILRDCQEYLLGASFEAREEGGLRPDTESSPGGARGRSTHSSPAGSYNKYHQGPGVMRSSSGKLSLSPSVASSARSSSLRSPDKSFQSPGRNMEQPLDTDYSSLQSEVSEHSPQSEAGPSSLKPAEARVHEYENVPTSNYIDGAGVKVSADSKASDTVVQDSVDTLGIFEGEVAMKTELEVERVPSSQEYEHSNIDGVRRECQKARCEYCGKWVELGKSMNQHIRSKHPRYRYRYPGRSHHRENREADAD